MTERISISIPDELSERLVAVKEKFNVSAVCQEAIEREVSRQELLLKGSDKIETVVERLILEKKRYDEPYKERGYKDGYRDAQRMSYDDLMEIIKGEELLYKTEAWLGWLQDQVKELYIEDAALNDDMYLDGWTEGVKAFWEEVKDQLLGR